MKKIKVDFPILVPEGKYCSEYKSPDVCDHFSNDGGYADCALHFYGQKESNKGVLKDPKCAALNIIKEKNKFMPKKIKMYKNNCVEDLISYDDFITVTGLDYDEFYTHMMEGPLEQESDGDFIYRIYLNNDEDYTKKLKEALPQGVIERNRFGVEFCQ